MYTFDSKARIGPTFQSPWNEEMIKNEPMFFNSDLEFAFGRGGPITKDFINAFLLDNDIPIADCVFDSRVHMLMKGWFPCIPGFHHDDVPRSTVSGQPNYDSPAYRSSHCFGLVNGDICPTEFALGNSDFSRVPDNVITYKHWHLEVEEKIKNGELERVSAPSGKLVYFNDRTWHQGVRARDSGWRWFGRISWNTARSKSITNEIRRQVQVYLEHPMEGW